MLKIRINSNLFRMLSNKRSNVLMFVLHQLLEWVKILTHFQLEVRVGLPHSQLAQMVQRSMWQTRETQLINSIKKMLESIQAKWNNTGTKLLTKSGVQTWQTNSQCHPQELVRCTTTWVMTARKLQIWLKTRSQCQRVTLSLRCNSPKILN